MSKFQLLSRPLGAIERFVIQCSSGAELEILSGHGAGLNAWRVANASGMLNLLYGYTDEAVFRKIQADTSAGVRLSPFAGRTNNAKWQLNGQSSYLDNNVSWAPHALHGLLHTKPWRFVSFKEENDFAELTLAYDYVGSHQGFPFPYRAETRFRFSGNSYQVISTVTNRGVTPMPYSEGYHPYYSLNTRIDELEMKLPSVKRVLLDNQDIPTGNYENDTRFQERVLIKNTEINDCFVLDPLTSKAVSTLHNPKNGDSLEIWQDSNYKMIQIYTPPDRQSIAIEPMTHEPDVLNHHRDLLIVSPGESLSFSFGSNFIPSV
jgi:aldose 1-epimerase